MNPKNPFQKNKSPIRINKTPLREKESFAHFRVTSNDFGAKRSGFGRTGGNVTPQSSSDTTAVINISTHSK